MVIFGALVILGIIAIQSYWFYETWDFKEKEFDRTVDIALQRVAENLAVIDSFQIPTIDLVKKASSNYYVVNINNTIDAHNLEYFLQREFQSKALNEDFEYGIFDCSSDEMVYGSYCSVDDREKNEHISRLPKYDKFTYYFGVKFPKRSSFILSKMERSIIFTLILFLTIIFFFYSMYIILRQKRLSDMQKDFINNMTHEFKTPISTINVSADVFINHPDIQQNERLSKYANIIKEQNNRLNMQVEKVLQIAALDKDNLKLKIEPLDLNEILASVLKSNEIKINEKKGQLYTSLISQSLPIKADKVHLTNILHNLLDNAIKYSKEKPEITVNTKIENNKILLEIADKGIGIPKEHQAKIFNKFYRIPTGNVHNVKGFGLGLYYVKNICDAHNWKIKLTSEKEQGTLITIRF